MFMLLLRLQFVLLVAPTVILGGEQSCSPQTFPGGQTSLSCLAFSPDGRTVVTGSHEGNPKVWDVSHLQLLQKIEGIEHTTAVAYSRAGTNVAFGNRDGVLRIWNTADWKESRVFPKKNPIDFLAYAQDDRTLIAAGSWGEVQLWDVATGRELAVLPTSTQQEIMTALTVSLSGDLLATAWSDGTIRLWDLNVKKERFILKGHLCSVGTLAFSPNGRAVASADEKGIIKLWSPSTGKALASWSGHEADVKALVFTNENFIVSSALDTKIKIWDTTTRHTLLECRADPNSHSSVYWIASCPTTKKLIFGSGPGFIMVFTPPDKVWTTTDVQQHSRPNGNSEARKASVSHP